MKTRKFYINLDSAPLRRKMMEEQFVKLGVSATRWPAVDGKNIDPEQCPHYRFDPQFWQLGGGEIACFLSHRQIWQRMVEKNMPCAVICEDDLRIGQDFAKIVRGIAEHIDQYGIVRLDTLFWPTIVWPPIATIAQRQIRPMKGFRDFTVCAYMLSRQAAERLSQASKIFSLNIDQWIFGQQQLIPVHQLWPAVCVQHMAIKSNREEFSLPVIENSTIIQHRELRERKFKEAAKIQIIRKKLLREIKRICNQMKYKIYYLFKGGKIARCPLEYEISSLSSIEEKIN